MKCLALTFDAAGNLPPMLGLAEALAARGHDVGVMGHASQKARIEAAGAAFHAFDTAPERNGDDIAAPSLTLGWLEGFEHAAAWDFLAAARRHRPDILIVDALLAEALAAANATSWPASALVHTPYETMVTFHGGRFRPGVEGADLAIISSFAAFHFGPPAPERAVFAGPLRPRQSAGAWTRRFPGRPLVLASLSSGAQVDRALLEALCAALAGIDAEAVVTLGRVITPAGLAKGPLMDLVAWAPHEVIASQADLVITHAGHGTVMASLAAGAPLLCIPDGGDQPANAAQVAALGLGEVLEKPVSAGVIRDTVRRLLADATLRARARAFAALVAAEPGSGPALDRLETLSR